MEDVTYRYFFSYSFFSFFPFLLEDLEERFGNGIRFFFSFDYLILSKVGSFVH